MHRFAVAILISGSAFCQNSGGQLKTLMAGHSTASIAYIGHSWVEGKTISVPLTTTLQAKYGNAGFGYVTCYAQSIAGQGAGRTLSGTWTGIDPVNLTSDAFVGADGYAANSSDIATPGNCQIRIPTDLGIQSTFDVHYLVQPGGGDFTYKVNNQSPVTVHTVGGSKVFGHTGPIAVSGAPVASATRLDLTVTVAGSSGVTIFGADFRITASGVVLHSLGHSGARTLDFLAQDATLWKAELSALSPDLIVFHCVVNDAAGSVGTSDYNTNLASLITEWRSALPNVVVVVVEDPQNGQTFSPPTSTYEAGLLAYTAANPAVGLIDLYTSWYTYPRSYDIGYIQSNFHPSSAGGTSMSDVIAAYLLGGGHTVFPGIVWKSTLF